MLLTIDVGNTNITLGIYHDSELGPRWRLATAAERTSQRQQIACPPARRIPSATSSPVL